MDLELIWFTLNKFLKLKNSDFFNNIGKITYQVQAEDYFDLSISNPNNQKIIITLENKGDFDEIKNLLDMIEFKPAYSGCFLFDRKEEVEQTLIAKDSLIPQNVVDYFSKFSESSEDLITVSDVTNKKKKNK